jgi:hypothetical protein
MRGIEYDSITAVNIGGGCGKWDHSLLIEAKVCCLHLAKAKLGEYDHWWSGRWKHAGLNSTPGRIMLAVLEL